MYRANVFYFRKFIEVRKYFMYVYVSRRTVFQVMDMGYTYPSI